MPLSSAEAGVVFDFHADGRPSLVAWPTNADDGFLAMDLNGNQQIDDGGELFGNMTRLRSGQRAQHGFEALDELDVNRDGFVSAQDPGFNQLRVWRDLVRNGRVDGAEELLSMAAAGVVSIGTGYKESQRVDEWGNEYRYIGVAYFARVPQRRFAVDVFLRSASAQE